MTRRILPLLRDSLEKQFMRIVVIEQKCPSTGSNLQLIDMLAGGRDGRARELKVLGAARIEAHTEALVAHDDGTQPLLWHPLEHSAFLL